jgi:hypothetical protein
MVLNRWVLTTPVQRAVFHFMTQTITRSLKHRVFLAVYAGFGVALAALSFASGEEGKRQVGLTLPFVLVSGLRAAFSFPSELRANWVFRLTATGSGREYLTAMRKWILVCGIGPLFALLAPFSLGMFHVAFGLALSLLLIEVLFLGFRKAAFACAYFPGRINLIGLGVIYVFGFVFYSRTMSALQNLLSATPAAATLSVAVIGCAAVLAARRGADSGESLDYEDDGDPVVRTLGVTSR